MADTNVTVLLQAIGSGSREAYEALLGQLYNELRSMAGAISHPAADGTRP
jgi:hypothetical protein